MDDPEGGREGPREDEVRLGRILDDLIARVHANQPLPGEDELIREYPEFADRLVEFLRGERGKARSADRGESRSGYPGIPDYEILRWLGRGGMGEVYLARQISLDRQVALKILRPSIAGHRRAVDRFLREARLAARLSHPGLVGVFDMGVHDEIAYIAYQYVEGTTLAERIRERRQVAARRRSSTPGGEPLPEGGDPGHVPATPGRVEVFAIAAIAEETARSLHVAHEAGLIHRDIKPANIMVRGDERPVILDFGLVREVDEDAGGVTRTGDLVGTPAYMSPEQLSSQRIQLDRRTDVYSLGVTLYECLALRPPFSAPTRERLYLEITTKEPPRLRSLNPAVPRDLEIVVATAMEKDRDHRYQTALELAEDLRRVRESRPISARPIAPPRRLARWARRNPGIAISLGVAGLCLVAALGTVFFAVGTRTGVLRGQLLARIDSVFRIGGELPDNPSLSRAFADGLIGLLPYVVGDDRSRVLCALAAVAAARGETESALKLLDRCEEEAPTEAMAPRWRLFRARLCVRVGRFDEARRVLETLRRTDAQAADEAEVLLAALPMFRLKRTVELSEFPGFSGDEQPSVIPAAAAMDLDGQGPLEIVVSAGRKHVNRLFAIDGFGSGPPRPLSVDGLVGIEGIWYLVSDAEGDGLWAVGCRGEESKKYISFWRLRRDAGKPGLLRAVLIKELPDAIAFATRPDAVRAARLRVRGSRGLKDGLLFGGNNDLPALLFIYREGEGYGIQEIYRTGSAIDSVAVLGGIGAEKSPRILVHHGDGGAYRTFLLTFDPALGYVPIWECPLGRVFQMTHLARIEGGQEKGIDLVLIGIANPIRMPSVFGDREPFGPRPGRYILRVEKDSAWIAGLDLYERADGAEPCGSAAGWILDERIAVAASAFYFSGRPVRDDLRLFMVDRSHPETVTWLPLSGARMANGVLLADLDAETDNHDELVLHGDTLQVYGR